MKGYRRGAVLGLTVAETFILLTFLLLFALLGLVPIKEPPPESGNAEASSSPGIWILPEEIAAITKKAEEARKATVEAEAALEVSERELRIERIEVTEARMAAEEADVAREIAESERDIAQAEAAAARMAAKEADMAREAAEIDRDIAFAEAADARKAADIPDAAKEDAEKVRDIARAVVADARKAVEEADSARDAAERERDIARAEAADARKAANEADAAREIAERERDVARTEAVDARKAAEEASTARELAEEERDMVQLSLTKGDKPPCWYQTISTGEGKTRERREYVFNVAVFEDSIAMEQRTAPRGGAFDDGDGLYSDEWEQLRIDELPYDRKLSDDEFIEAITSLVKKGRNRQVRTYDCIFSVMVWDKTPDHAKKRWKMAYHQIIESYFNGYPVKEDEWKGIE